MSGESACKKCAQRIDPKGDLFTICDGDCGLWHHAKCARLTERDLSVLSKNVIWMCDDCMDTYRRTREGIGSNSANRTTMDSEMEKSTVEDEVKELKKTVAGIMDTLAKMIPTASTIDPCLTHSTPLASPVQHNRANANNTSLECTDPRQQSTTDENFSLLLSNIDVCATESDIRRMVGQTFLGCIPDPEHIDVTKLVSNWRSRRNVDYVSFKAVLDNRLRSKAMNPSTWPKHVTFREFVSKCNDTWKPLY